MTTYDLATFGEGQIRLTVGKGDRLSTATQLRMTAAGSEANVAGLLAQLSRRTTWASVIPTTDLGTRVMGEYRSVGVDLSHVIRTGDERIALYFMEPGDPPMPARVTYDRLHTKFREITPETFDWDGLLDTRVLFVTGITASLTEQTAAVVTHAVEQAAARGSMWLWMSTIAACCGVLNRRVRCWNRCWTRCRSSSALGPTVRRSSGSMGTGPR